MAARLVALVMVALMLASPLHALAQQMSQTPQPDLAQSQSAPQPETVPSQPEQPEVVQSPSAQPELAQSQPAQPEPAQPQPAQPQPAQPEPAPAQPQLYQGSVQAQPAPEPLPTTPIHKTDAYDVGANIMNVVGVPLKAGVCAIGTIFAAALFLMTAGNAQATTAVVEEGCMGRWTVTGDDIRPHTRPQVLMQERYDRAMP